MKKIVSCCSTKDKTYTPPAGVKIDKCKSCNTLIWLPREADAAKTSGREPWCKECVESKATPEDDILGKSIHNENKEDNFNDVFTTLDERIVKQHKEVLATTLANLDDKLGMLSSVAINNLAPSKDAEHLMLCSVLKLFLEERLIKMRESMGPNSTLADVFNRFDANDKLSILTFLIGTYHATRIFQNSNKFPSWNRKDNGQDEEYEKTRDKSWEWEEN
jgi:hypothetical protein